MKKKEQKVDPFFEFLESTGFYCLFRACFKGAYKHIRKIFSSMSFLSLSRCVHIILIIREQSVSHAV